MQRSAANVLDITPPLLWKRASWVSPAFIAESPAACVTVLDFLPTRMFVHDQQLTATWAYVFDLQLDCLLIHKHYSLTALTRPSVG